MTNHIYRVVAACLSLLAGAASLTGTETVILNDPDYPFFHATAMDQPRLYGLLTDNGEVMQDENGPVVFRAFIDTGSSGFVLSHLHAAPNNYDVASFEFDETDDYIGTYTNLGIGGQEVGSVSRPFGVLLYNDPFPTEGSVPVTDFDNYGEHSLWVRQSEGLGEVVVIPIPIWEDWTIDYTLISPVNIVGMPVIAQRSMVMEWQPLPPELLELLPEISEHVKEIRTRLLPHGDSLIPGSNITLDLEMRDFVGEPSPGETLPSMNRNPLVKNITISHDPGHDSLTGNWLFDTGAGSSFISFNWAKQIGLIPASYEDLETFVDDHIADDGMVAQIGGIGDETVIVPIMNLNEIRVPAREGFDIVWQNVRILVFDHPDLAELELEGIFGMNLIGPAATIDTRALEGGGLGGDATQIAALLNLLSDVTPSPFNSIVFEVTGEETAELQLFSPRIPPAITSFADWRSLRFGPEEKDVESISGPQADPDNDGIPNLLEYALARDPTAPSRKNLPTPIIEEFEEELYLTFTYTRIKPAADLEFIVETSHDMADWRTDETVVANIEDLGSRERITVRDTQPWDSTASRFLRLRVNLLTPAF